MIAPRRILAFTVGLMAFGLACHKVPYTGRVQYNLIPDGVMRTLGKVTYAEMLSGKGIARGNENSEVLKRVGRRVSTVANQPKFDWQFSLIREDTVNAWCLPGGYIGFYTGILPILRHEAAMAFVMGHEVAHATAHHGAERVSQQLTLLGGLAGLNLYLAGRSKLDDQQRALVLGALGVGAEFGVMLPFSRAHESEADVIGMMYMAEAGYPPAESIPVWDRMKEASGPGLPGFLSTHPTSEKRKENLREWLPRAKKRYERNKLAEDTTRVLWGRG